MRRALLLLWLCACTPPPAYPDQPSGEGPDNRYGSAQYVPPEPPVPSGPVNLDTLGRLDDHLVDFDFDGGQLEFDLFADGDQVTQTARNRYMVPVQIAWTITPLENIEGAPLKGSTTLPAAPGPDQLGEPVILSRLRRPATDARYRRDFRFRARFGNVAARPADYAYALPFPTGSTFTVLQGFHGEFSHRGSNEYAVDFDCPVATPVLAAREGTVVVTHASAQGAGTTPEYLDYKRVNFVLVQHDDGTLGEYMHLSPSGVMVRPGQRVGRHQQLALSGNTGFSTQPHLHFQIMTAASDGISAVSFPFRFAASRDNTEEPVQGHRYTAWE
ncbi:MAG TPA: M23 family metallopeptidase [Kofleriaceae bacterium]|jgi:murein DD-endopeptidase MepM/ murein hydrolase activator NlpD